MTKKKEKIHLQVIQRKFCVCVFVCVCEGILVDLFECKSMCACVCLGLCMSVNDWFLWACKVPLAAKCLVMERILSEDINR